MSLDWIDKHREQYLEDGEKAHMWDSSVVGGPGPRPTILLFTKGRKSGRTSIMPLLYGKSGDDIIVIASKGGAPAHPDWYFNLTSNPEVEVKLANDQFPARAETVTDERRAALWDIMVEVWPDYVNYQKKTEREIPVVLLHPTK
jgi:deazaflavin-dependent oxidoreductase (nitroreductase family)